MVDSGIVMLRRITSFQNVGVIPATVFLKYIFQIFLFYNMNIERRKDVLDWDMELRTEFGWDLNFALENQPLPPAPGVLLLFCLGLVYARRPWCGGKSTETQWLGSSWEFRPSSYVWVSVADITDCPTSPANVLDHWWLRVILLCSAGQFIVESGLVVHCQTTQWYCCA